LTVDDSGREAGLLLPAFDSEAAEKRKIMNEIFKNAIVLLLSYIGYTIATIATTSAKSTVDVTTRNDPV
jgi:ERCC4-type nuclease